MQWWALMSVIYFCVSNTLTQTCSGTEQLQRDNLQWAINRGSELLHHPSGSCFSTFALSGTLGSQNIVTFMTLWRVISRKPPFIPLLTTAGVKDGGDLSGRQVSSHLASYRSKSIAQTPLEYQQTGGESLRKLMCVPCLPKLCLHKKDERPSSVPDTSWLMFPELNIFISQTHVPTLRLPQLCPTS